MNDESDIEVLRGWDAIKWKFFWSPVLKLLGVHPEQEAIRQKQREIDREREYQKFKEFMDRYKREE